MSSSALFHVTVKAVVVYQDQMLILKKVKKSKDGFGYWEFPGGGMENGESCQDAIKREVKEECGLDVSVVHALSTFHVVRSGHEIIGIIFLCQASSDAVVLSDEHTAFKFISKEEGKDYLSPVIYQNAFKNHPQSFQELLKQLENESQ